MFPARHPKILAERLNLDRTGVVVSGVGAPMQDDEELIGQVAAGSETAFDALLERYGPRVRAVLLRIVRDDSTTDDLSQEVFLRLWTRAEQWEGRGSLGGWLSRMARNLALDHLRSAKRKRLRPLEFEKPFRPEEEGEDLVPSWMIEDALSRPDELAELAERADVLGGLLSELPERQRLVIRMVHEEELDIQEVADRLGIPPGTVKSRLHYARKVLARRWPHVTGEEESP